MADPVEKRLAEFLQTCMQAAWQGNDMACKHCLALRPINDEDCEH